MESYDKSKVKNKLKKKKKNHGFISEIENRNILTFANNVLFDH